MSLETLGKGLVPAEEEKALTGGDSNEATTASLAKPVKKIKLYTPESMSSDGGYSLKSVQDVEQSAEGQQRKLRERAAKADWRARRKEPTSSEGNPDGRIRCQAHKDPDCVAEECVDDFFDDWDYFEEGIVANEEPRRVPTVFNKPRAVQAESTAVQIPMDSETLGATEARIAQVTRSRGHRPYMTCAARDFLRHMGDWPGFTEADGMHSVSFIP
jgi:hypothetical protein